MKNGSGSATRLVALVAVVASSCLAQFGCASAPEGERQNAENAAAIRAVLDSQAAAWNRGDIEGYMDGYERGDQTVFVSGDNVTRGWQTVLDRYKKSYDTREKMGTLAFSDLDIKPLSPFYAAVTGRWQLARAADAPHGRFTLIFRKTSAGWRIVHDHTSSAP
ncbi:MAG: nuclear transport factor 2 family protein [Acidobacteria bacterium]|nr:nuclear transport factor 2 family protein [Acidobacteriota bacterium]